MSELNLFPIILGLVFSIAFPVGLVVWWKKNTGESLWCFLSGALCFILFAYVLEAGLHQLVLGSGSALSSAILSSPVLYMLYGSFAAGIFEETGRLFGFTVLLRRHREKSALSPTESDTAALRCFLCWERPTPYICLLSPG